MDHDHYERLRTLFDEASGMPPDAHENFLADRCAGDPALHEELRHLLLHAASPHKIFEAPPAIDGAADSPPLITSEVPGYSIQRLIGEGGFGAVYEAKQLQPVQRSVALKLIKYGSFSKTTQSRFTIECQALARVDHPSIAHVFDAGTTPAGHLFCAMELIDGPSICEFANEHQLSARERIELILTVSDAVQHAHQRGILHRDLKPSNILVTRLAGKPLPKIIDFGIAKIRDDELPGAEGLTLHGEFLGTPIYMSPEQADAACGDVDTRSDVYSLAVVLYELLTGTTPVKIRSSSPTGLEAVLRSLREDDAPLASKRLQDLGKDGERHAERCGSTRDALLRVLRGDLDRVLAMALEKDRSRRYESPQQFGADLARVLRNEAVLAQSPTTTYLLRKFARRNRGKLAAGATVLVLLLTATIGTTIGLFQVVNAQDKEIAQRKIAEREQERAQLEARISREIVAFLNDDLLAAVAPEGLGIDATMREALDTASARIEGRFAELPVVEVAVRTTLGATYRALGVVEPALHHLERARALSEQHLDADDVRRLRALRELGATLYAMGRNDDAEPLLVGALDRSVRVFGEGHEETLAAAFHLASVYAERPDQADALALVDCWLPICRRELGPAHPQTIQFAFGLGQIYSVKGEPQKALLVFEDAYRLARSELGETHRLTLMLISELAAAKLRSGAQPEAETMLRDAWQASAEKLGKRHPATLILQMKCVASFMHDLARTHESNALLEEMIETWPTVQRADHPNLLDFWNFAAAMFVAHKEDKRAAECLEKIVRFEDSAPPGTVLESLRGLYSIAVRADDPDTANAWKERFDKLRARELSRR